MSADLPLSGVKVLDLAWVVAGPAIARSLADYGATVVHVESRTRVDPTRLMGPFPQGKSDVERSALFDTANAGKLGLALDLGRPESQEIVRDLVRWADLVVESFAPGQLARWGLAPEALRALNPSIVGLSTCLMGQSGPLSPVAGFGNIGASVAGFQNIVGWPGALPVGPFGPYTDFVAPRFGIFTVLAALDHRRLTGEGCWLDLSQGEAGIQFLGAEIAEGAATGRYAAANGNRDPQFAPHGVFRARGDDDWVAIVARNDAEWRTLAHEIGGAAEAAAFATLEGRKAEEDHLEAVIAAWTSDKDAHDIERRLQGLGVPAHKASSGPDVIADPQMEIFGHFVRLSHATGEESLFESSRYRLSDTPAVYRRPAPPYGRDNRTVLAEILGYESARIDQLEASGALT